MEKKAANHDEIFNKERVDSFLEGFPKAEHPSGGWVNRQFIAELIDKLTAAEQEIVTLQRRLALAEKVVEAVNKVGEFIDFNIPIATADVATTEATTFDKEYAHGCNAAFKELVSAIRDYEGV